MLATPTLLTERLRLRPFEAGDSEDLWSLHGDPEVMRYWDSPPWRDPARAQRFLDGCRDMESEGTGTRLAVEQRGDGRFLGWCALNRWNPEFRSASLGYLYRRDTWGRGHATEAARALVGWAFDTLDLNRLQGEVDTRNPASARVLEKLGFQREGELREDTVVDGVVSDSWIYGLLRREWRGYL